MSTANSKELVGKVSFIENLPFDSTFGGFILKIKSMINNKFLYYFLKWLFLNGKFVINSTQTTNIANINTVSLGEYTVYLPPESEQIRIVKQVNLLMKNIDKVKAELN